MRRTPLRRTAAPKMQRQPIRAVNPERRRKLNKLQFGEAAERVRRMGCLVCGHSPSEAAHVRSRGAGGTSKDLVPLCTDHHHKQHQMGIRTFQEVYRVDLRAAADRIAAELAA